MGGRIMVVDDDAAILDTYHEILTDDGFEVVGCRYPPSDLAEIERLDPDLIVLDLLFGADVAGIALLQALKANQGTAAIPMLMCTASDHALRQWQSLLASFHVPVVIKPFDLYEFLSMVRATVRRRQQQFAIPGGAVGNAGHRSMCRSASEPSAIQA